MQLTKFVLQAVLCVSALGFVSCDILSNHLGLNDILEKSPFVNKHEDSSDTLINIQSQIKELIRKESVLLNKTIIIYRVEIDDKYVTPEEIVFTKKSNTIRAKRGIRSFLQRSINAIKIILVDKGVLTNLKTHCLDFLEFTGKTIVNEILDHLNKRSKRAVELTNNTIAQEDVIEREQILDGQETDVVCKKKTGIVKSHSSSGYINIFDEWSTDLYPHGINGYHRNFKMIGIRDRLKSLLNEHRFNNHSKDSCLCQVIEAVRIINKTSSLNCYDHNPTLTLEFIIFYYTITDRSGQEMCTKAMTGDISDFVYWHTCMHPDEDPFRCWHARRWEMKDRYYYYNPIRQRFTRTIDLKMMLDQN